MCKNQINLLATVNLKRISLMRQLLMSAQLKITFVVKLLLHKSKVLLNVVHLNFDSVKYN